MAKLIASETGKECVESFRIHGGYGYRRNTRSSASTGTPAALIGEGTSEIQRMVIGKKLPSATRSDLTG